MVKRFLFLEETIRSHAPKEVLDIGCGNGHYLTIPLACSFPGVRFLGVDTDRKSIEQARSANSLANLEFLLPGEVREGGKFDFIIASEIIEHVEDPEGFLLSLKERLHPGGKVFLSMPNGYGPFELSCFFEAIVYLLFLQPLMRGKQAFLSFGRGGTRGRGISLDGGMERDMLAGSPHVNFFSLRSIYRLIANAGLGIVAFSSRTFLCGHVFDQLIRSDRWILWNASVADSLPKIFASDWMFLLEPKPQPTEGGRGYRRTLFAKLRRWISLHRFSAETAGESR